MSFEANPNSENELWIEKPAIQGVKFRIWHLMFFCLCAFGVLVVLICCCIKIRVPRTKQEIEADYRRKIMATKFRKRLKIISNQDMEAIDLRKALEIIIEADYNRDLRKHQETTVIELPTEDDVHLVPETNKKTTFGRAVANVIKIGKVSLTNKLERK